MKMKIKFFRKIISVIMFSCIVVQAKVFAVEFETKTISSVDDLVDAIVNQDDNQIWEIQEGTYILKKEDLEKYSTWGSIDTLEDLYDEKAGQGNWYFPIHKDNISIIGIGNVTITSNVDTQNGSWASQDFISIWGDNVTIEGVNIKCKKDQNKAIEVMGKNVTLRDINLQKVDENGSGSIIFNSQKDGDIGKATIENVSLYSWISATYSTSGSLFTKNVTIDFTDNFYAGYSDKDLGYAWCPLINVNSDIELNNINFKLLVDDKINLTEQVFTESLPDNSTIVLMQDVTVDEMLNIKKSNITFDLNNHTLTSSNTFTNSWDNNNDSNLLQVYEAQNVTIKNGSLVTTKNNKHGINIYESNDVVLENINIDNTNTLGGAPIIINNSSAIVKGKLDLKIGENSWYGINIDPKDGNASLIFADDSSVSMLGSSEKQPVIELDGDRDNITVSGVAKVGLTTDENGNFIINTNQFNNEVINPNTLDNLINYIILLILSIVGISGLLFTKKKYA